MFKNLICWFILICSISAFHLSGLGKGDRVLDILGIAIIVFSLALYITYQGKAAIKVNFSSHVIILFIAVFFSVIIAKKFNNQAIGLTLYEQRAIYFYLFYFLLHYLMPEPEDLKKMIMVFALLYCSLYLVQKVVYPTIITDSAVFVDRGTLRIFMPGSSIMVFGYFIAFQKIFEKFDWFSLTIIILTLCIVFLLAGRQLIISLFIISFINLLFNKKINNRYLITGLFIIALTVLGFVMRDIVNDMTSLTLKHSQEGTGYIRFKAAKYFLVDFQKNYLTFIFGNGEPTERSPYGYALAQITKHNGFYLSDLGLIGAYIKFGIIFVIGVILILLKILFAKTDTRITFIKNFFICVTIMLFTTGSIFVEKEGIVIVCIAFYIIDYYKHRPHINNAIVT